MKCVLKYYCRIIGHRVFTIILIGATVIYWYFAFLGALTIKTRLDTVKILPKDSPIQVPNRILNDISMILLINCSFNFFNTAIQLLILHR